MGPVLSRSATMAVRRAIRHSTDSYMKGLDPIPNALAMSLRAAASAVGLPRAELACVDSTHHPQLALLHIQVSRCGKAVIRSFAAAYGTSVIFSSNSSLRTGLCGTTSATPSSDRQSVNLRAFTCSFTGAPLRLNGDEPTGTS